MNNDYLAISKEYTAFDQIAFVLTALSKDETRYILTHMKVIREGHITRYVATDGHRLHIAELDPGFISEDLELLDDGIYTLISKTAKHIVLKKTEEYKTTYPNWEQVAGSYMIGDPLSEICHIADPGKIGEIMIRTHKLLDTTFLAQALGYGSSRKSSESVHAQFQISRDDHGPITIAHDHGTAFLMPLRRAEVNEDDTDDTPSHTTAPLEALKDVMKEDTNGKATPITSEATTPNLPNQ